MLEFAAAVERSRAAHSHEILQHRELERALEDASSTIEELQQQLRAAKAELMTMETASMAALDVLRSARGAAQTIRRSIDVVPAAEDTGR